MLQNSFFGSLWWRSNGMNVAFWKEMYELLLGINLEHKLIGCNKSTTKGLGDCVDFLLQTPCIKENLIDNKIELVA